MPFSREACIFFLVLALVQLLSIYNFQHSSMVKKWNSSIHHKAIKIILWNCVAQLLARNSFTHAFSYSAECHSTIRASLSQIHRVFEKRTKPRIVWRTEHIKTIRMLLKPCIDTQINYLPINVNIVLLIKILIARPKSIWFIIVFFFGWI